jgi:hypothetical protein
VTAIGYHASHEQFRPSTAAAAFMGPNDGDKVLPVLVC